MSIEIKVPTLPESVADATVAKWYKKVGDTIERDENLVDLETDKVMLEVPAPKAGVLQKIASEEGAVVKPDDLLAVIGDDAAEAQKAPEAEKAPSKPAPQPQAAAPPQPAPKPQPAAQQPPQAAQQAAPQVEEPELDDEHHLPAGPAVRRLAQEYHINLDEVEATGRGGRVTKEDIAHFIEMQEAKDKAAQYGGAATPQPAPISAPAPAQPKPQAAPAPAAQPASEPEKQQATAPATGQVRGDRTDKRVPMSRLRQRVAERLVESQKTAAILTTFNEIDMKPVMDLRARYKDQFERSHGVRLGFMSFFVKAAVEALKRFPVVNASIDGTDIVYHNYFDIGVAIGSPRGLVVPIVRDADVLSMADIEMQIRDFAQRAQSGRLAIEEMTGGTFTISNGGTYGSMMSTPIINPPQCGILGMHKITERPVVENGQIVVRPMMYVAMSYDHRIIDGSESVRFLVTIKEMIEDPARLVLSVQTYLVLFGDAEITVLPNFF